MSLKIALADSTSEPSLTVIIDGMNQRKLMVEECILILERHFALITGHFPFK